MGKLLKEYNDIAEELLNGTFIIFKLFVELDMVPVTHELILHLLGNIVDCFAGITEESFGKSLSQLHELNSVNINDFHLPNLPKPPNSFRGIRAKSSSLRRWLAICTDDSTP